MPWSGGLRGRAPAAIWGAAVVLALLTAGGQPASASAAAQSTAWAQGDGDAALSRSNPTENTITAATVSRVRWLRTVDGGGQYVNPVLSGNWVYAVTDSVITAVNASTGAVIWRYVAPTAGLQCDCFEFSALSVVNGVVFAGGYSTDSDLDGGGAVFALRAGTGTQIWTTGFYNTTGPVFSMVVSGGYVVALGSSPDRGESVQILRASSGSLAWRKFGYTDTWYGRTAVIGGNVIWARQAYETGAFTLEADRLATGATVWSRPGRWRLERGDGDSASSGHHIYAVDPADLVDDLDPASGVTEYTLPAAAEGVVAVGGGQIYATSATRLCAYDLAGNGPKWCRPASWGAAAASVAAGVVYIKNVALSARTGQLLKTFPRPVVSVGNGRVALTGLALYGLSGY